MTTACVSHEMRNPLNAISALNKVKRRQYNSIIKIVNNNDLSLLVKIDKIKHIMGELMEGNKV